MQIESSGYVQSTPPAQSAATPPAPPEAAPQGTPRQPEAPPPAAPVATQYQPVGQAMIYQPVQPVPIPQGIQNVAPPKSQTPNPYNAEPLANTAPPAANQQQQPPEAPNPEPPAAEPKPNENPEGEENPETWDKPRAASTIKHLRSREKSLTEQTNLMNRQLSEATSAIATLQAELQVAKQTASDPELPVKYNELASKYNEVINQYNSASVNGGKAYQEISEILHRSIDSEIKNWPDAARKAIPERNEADAKSRYLSFERTKGLAEQLKTAPPQPGNGPTPAPLNGQAPSNPVDVMRQESMYATKGL